MLVHHSQLKVSFESLKSYLSLYKAFLCSLKMSDRKAVIKNADMSEEMQQVWLEVLLKVKETLLEIIFF